MEPLSSTSSSSPSPLPSPSSSSAVASFPKLQGDHQLQRQSARHSLLSIYFDSQTFLHSVIQEFQQRTTKPTVNHEQQKRHLFPIVSNERCGTWYAYPHIATSSSSSNKHDDLSSGAGATATAAPTTHFKSTDGHLNIHNFSLKRLNLKFLSLACQVSNQNYYHHQKKNNDNGISVGGAGGAGITGAVLIVDASKTKIQPDSFSKTLPIWCCVLNRLVLEYKNEMSTNNNNINNNNDDDDDDDDNNHDVDDDNKNEWDTDLYTPSFITKKENDDIVKVIPHRVATVKKSGVILDVNWFISIMKKPLRCFWISHSSSSLSSEHEGQGNNDYICNTIDSIEPFMSKYTCIICVSVSQLGVGTRMKQQQQEQPISHCSKHVLKYVPNPTCIDDEVEVIYTTGAADDHEFRSWSKGLTPLLFWKYYKEILFKKERMTIKETDEAIRAIMKKIKSGGDSNNDNDGDSGDDNGTDQVSIETFFDNLHGCNISIGSRKAGRPPLCWDYFDAILNVSNLEYDEMSSRDFVPEDKYYLQLNVKEGKRDRSELEKWLAVGVMFISLHAAASNRRVLVHCAQGMDRSVAVVLAAICLFCKLSIQSQDHETDEHEANTSQHIVFHPWCQSIDIHSFTLFAQSTGLNIKDTIDDRQEFKCSGMQANVVSPLLGREGRDLLFKYISYLSQGEQVDEKEEYYFATKESMRKCLVAIQHFRDNACPTRKTIQKVNRFFMSNMDGKI